MAKNMAVGDRVARGLFAVLAFGAIAMHYIDGPLAWVVGVIAAVLGITAIVGNCPLYKALGIDGHEHDGHEHYGG